MNYIFKVDCPLYSFKLHHSSKLNQSVHCERVTILDRPCGTGKTTDLINELKSRGRSKALIIVPLLTEVDRFLSALPTFVTPSEEKGKTRDMFRLLSEGENIICCHALYPNLAEAAEAGLLSDYDIYIDEVPEVVRQNKGVSRKSFEDVYLEPGYVTVEPDGKLRPTSKWDVSFEAMADTLIPEIYYPAKAGCLYVTPERYFIWALPPSLLSSGKSLTILTYLAEGSCLVAYLRKLGIPYTIKSDTAEDQEFRKRARDLLSIRTIPRLEEVAFTYTSQGKVKTRKVSKELQRLREDELRGVPHQDILLTCRKDNWFNAKGTAASGFSKGTRMQSVHWAANTTRGTNQFSHCSHAVYLYDQHLNPFLANWLGISEDEKEKYALSELVQWIWRTRIRRGEPVTVYLPSRRMRRLLQDFLS